MANHAAFTLEPRGFLAHEQAYSEEAKLKWEILWVLRFGPLNAPIQSGAIIEVSVSKSDSEMASDWIGMFKGPNVCTQRFSCVSPLRHMLVRKWENLWVPV